LAAVLSTVSSVAICYVNFATWKFPPGVTFAMACGFRVDNVATALPATVVLMALFYLGPLVASTMLVFVSRRYAVGGDGSLRVRDRPLPLLTSLWGHLARYVFAAPCVCCAFVWQWARPVRLSSLTFRLVAFVPTLPSTPLVPATGHTTATR
jgi:hypothetical protein